MTMMLFPRRALQTVLLGAGLALFAADVGAKPKKPPLVQQDPMETENSLPPPGAAPAEKAGFGKDGSSATARSGRPASSSSAGSTSVTSSATDKAGFFMLNLKIGPALCAYPGGCAHQGSLVLDLGAALTANRNGYLILPLQLQFRPDAFAVIVPIGFQYDVRLPLPNLYFYPRISAGYAAVVTNVPSGGTAQTLLNSGVIIAELGIKYVLHGRWNFGGEAVSLPLFLNSSGAQLYYRFHLSVGVNL